jgi:hypothetical protein
VGWKPFILLDIIVVLKIEEIDVKFGGKKNENL